MRGCVLTALVVMTLASSGAARAGERLLVPQMDGWRQLFSHAGSTAEVTEMIPAAETPAGWTRRLTIQAFRALDLPVSEVLETVVQRSSEICEVLEADTMRLGYADGIEVGMRAVACGRYRGGDKGEYVLYYALRGTEAFYLVSRAWRGPAFRPGTIPVSQPEQDEWKRFLRAARLCDPASAKRPCR